MKITPDELSINGYTLLERVEYSKLTPFIKTYLKAKTMSAIFYRIIKIILILAVLLFFIEYYISSPKKVFATIHFFYGFLIVIALLPLHKYIHVMVFKYFGAKKTSVRIDYKTLAILAIADKFVLNKKEFRVVVLAPFVIISLLLIISLFFVAKFWVPAILGTLFMHTWLCMADMALSSYLDFHKGKEIVTYDDKNDKAMYFYIKERSPDQ